MLGLMLGQHNLVQCRFGVRPEFQGNFDISSCNPRTISSLIEIEIGDKEQTNFEDVATQMVFNMQGRRKWGLEGSADPPTLVKFNISPMALHGKK